MAIDIVIVGGGPGGYPAAIRLSQLGYNVTIIEKDKVGGECTNYGCVPTKALLKAAKLARDLIRFNWISGSINPIETFEWANYIAENVRSSLDDLLSAYDINIIKDEALLLKETCIVTKHHGTICPRLNTIIATGSEPKIPSGFSIDGKLIHTNRTILQLRDLPERILIVGAGYVGIEYSYILSSLGSKVYLVEMLDRPLPSMDKDVGLFLRKQLRQLGIDLFLKTMIKSVSLNHNFVKVKLSGRRNTELEVDAILFAVGRRPNTIKGLEESGVQLDQHGFIRTDCYMRTSNPRIYAVGDVTGPPLLAHKAMVEGVTAAENIAGETKCLDNLIVPEVVFIEPEIVHVGRNTRENENVSVKIRVNSLAKAKIEGSEGFVKITFNAKSKVINDIVLVYNGASEAAGEALRIIRSKATIEDALEIVHPHPTLSEAISEVLLLAENKPLHILGKIK